MDEGVGTDMEFHLFLPQMRMALDAMAARAATAEAAGFRGIALMDHLAPPQAVDQPMYEAMVTATWLAARTERLVVGHLVLCDALRHPALLARQAVSIDHAANGRFELGIGWGSVPDELETFGVGLEPAPVRVRRLAETLDIMRALWTGEAIDYAGEFFTLRSARQLPVPLGSIPILIGGSGRRTLELVAKHADVWNLPTGSVARLEELRPQAGAAKVSVQQLIALVPSEAARAQVTDTAQRRFGWMGDSLVIGDPDEITAYVAAMRDRGVERIYAWFADFAMPETLTLFGERVIAQLA
jgi:alkanesulfonate monooxygenase SsuD/methylene tetrahydromethanopterin reductase-like flavin-dependent oxidoreductase (luciferase family)